MLSTIKRELLESSSLRLITPSRMVATSFALGVFAMPQAALAVDSNNTQLPTVTVEADKSSGDGGYKPDELSSPKYTSPLLDTAQTITVVPGEVIQDQNAMSLRDIVKNVPGITVAAGEGGPPNGDNLTIRGFSSRTDIFVDGVRDIGGYFRDSFNVDSAEVAKGPSSAYAGRGGTGGTVNLVGKRAEFRNFSNGDITVGTDNLQRLTADGNYKIDGLEGAAIRLNAMVHTEEVAGRDHAENERWGFAPTLSFGLGTDTELKFSYLHQQENNIPDYGHPYFGGGTIVSGEGVPLPASSVARPVNVPRENFYGLLNRDYEDNQVDMGTVELDHTINDEMSVNNITRYSRMTKDVIVTPPRSPDVGAGTLNLNGRDKDSTDTIFLNQTNLTNKFATGNINHTLVTGAEFGWETFENNDRDISTITGASLFNPDPFAPFTGTITPGATTKADANSQAVYAFDTLELNKQWQVMGGLRYDRFDADVSSSEGTSFERTDNMLSWRGSVNYKPRENGSIYVAYGTSFNPSAEALSLSADNAGLDPEESETYELGTKWDLFNKRLGITTAIFRTNKTNALTEDPITEVVVLDGEQRVDGLELGITGQLTDEWRVFAGYTYMTSEIKSSDDPDEVGKDVNRTPEHTFNLWTTYDVTPEFEVGGGVFYVDDRFSNDTNSNEVEGYVTADAMASYTLTENVALRLNVTNVFDEEYYDAVGGGHAIPGRGRTAMLTTGLKF